MLEALASLAVDIGPRTIDGILVLTAVEALVLGGWLRSRGHAALVPVLLLFLASGGCLLAGLRFGLTGSTGGALGACLFGAFVLHLLCLRAGRAWIGDAGFGVRSR